MLNIAGNISFKMFKCINRLRFQYQKLDSVAKADFRGQSQGQVTLGN